MLRIIATVFAVGILTACDSGTTGPTPTDGDVEFRLLKYFDYSSKWIGEGYNFATCENFLVTPRNGVFFKLDIGFVPGFLPNGDVMVCTSGQRIYMGEEPVSSFYLDSGNWANFELVTLDGKARYNISVKCKYYGINERRTGRVYKIFMYYKILDT